MNKSDW